MGIKIKINSEGIRKNNIYYITIIYYFFVREENLYRNDIYILYVKIDDCYILRFFIAVLFLNMF